MITYCGKKTTAKKLAQRLLASKVTIVGEFFDELAGVDYSSLTEKEKQECAIQIEKLEKRILKLLNV
jgi:hypothetical protein